MKRSHVVTALVALAGVAACVVWGWFLEPALPRVAVTAMASLWFGHLVGSTATYLIRRTR